jgi:glycine C-acetyltransferase
VFVDDRTPRASSARPGAGTHEKCGVVGKIDILTTTFGKALGGASGGCVSGRSEIVEMCRQRARPYLFSNAMAPVIIAGVLKAFEILKRSTELRDNLEENARYWRKGLSEAGFVLKKGDTPSASDALQRQAGAGLRRICMRKASTPSASSSQWWQRPGQNSRPAIRGHEKRHLDRALEAFIKVGRSIKSWERRRRRSSPCAGCEVHLIQYRASPDNSGDAFLLPGAIPAREVEHVHTPELAG